MQITINEDSTFFVCDESGDVNPGADLGLYYQDTRFLSLYQLRVAGTVPEHLTSYSVTYFHALHVLTNCALESIREGSLGIVRSQTVGNGFHEDIDITNYSETPVRIPIDIYLSADYEDILGIRGQIVTGEKREAQHKGRYWASPSEDNLSLTFHFSEDGYNPSTSIRFSRPLKISTEGEKVSAEANLEPRETWHLWLDISTSAGPGEVLTTGPGHVQVGRSEEVTQLRRQEEKLLAAAPRFSTDDYLLEQAYKRSIRDFASLRLRGPEVPSGEYVVAAGIPWFTALFGRDSLIAAYQTLPYLPEIAIGTLRVLARYQGTKVNAENDEQPGKILHEFRTGQTVSRHMWITTWPYYGSVDSTILFIILYSEVYRLLGDLDFLHELLGNAERALEWMDRYGDRDGDGYIEYINETGTGLESQGWKDSWNAIQFHDGRVAKPPIALCEVQGYAYDAKMRMADIYDDLGKKDRATELRNQAHKLKERFNKDFWLPNRNYYAIALDEEKNPVDGLASNQGQALWSGIVDDSRIPGVIDILMAADMFSGWGIRTLGKSEGGYSPLGYHVGSVWPHDNSIIASGFAKHGYKQQTGSIFKGLLQVTSARPARRLPELFSGYGKDQFPFPVDFPIASGIQAWASGTPLLLLSCLLGFSANARRKRIYLNPFLPEGTNRIEIDGLHVGDGELQLSIERVYGEIQTRLRKVPKGFKVEGTIFRWSIFW